MVVLLGRSSRGMVARTYWYFSRKASTSLSALPPSRKLSKLRSPNMPILSRSSWKCRKMARNMQRPLGIPPETARSCSTICWNRRPKRPLRTTLSSLAAISRSNRGKRLSATSSADDFVMQSCAQRYTSLPEVRWTRPMAMSTWFM